MAAAKGAPPAAVIQSPPGASPPRARRPARTSPPPSSSWRAATRGKRTSEIRRAQLGEQHGTFNLEGPVRRRLSAQEGRGLARVGPARNDQDLEPAVNHSAAVRWPHLWGLQRPEAYPG